MVITAFYPTSSQPLSYALHSPHFQPLNLLHKMQTGVARRRGDVQRTDAEDTLLQKTGTHRWRAGRDGRGGGSFLSDELPLQLPHALAHGLDLLRLALLVQPLLSLTQQVVLAVLRLLQCDLQPCHL